MLSRSLTRLMKLIRNEAGEICPSLKNLWRLSLLLPVNRVLCTLFSYVAIEYSLSHNGDHLSSLTGMHAKENLTSCQESLTFQSTEISAGLIKFSIILL